MGLLRTLSLLIVNARLEKCALMLQCAKCPSLYEHTVISLFTLFYPMNLNDHAVDQPITYFHRNFYKIGTNRPTDDIIKLHTGGSWKHSSTAVVIH